VNDPAETRGRNAKGVFMRNRLISLLVLSIVLAAAPSLMAQCLKCRPLQHTCVVATTGGYDLCYWANDCILGEACIAFVEEMPPLASEFQVVSVERLDEPQSKKPDETRVALLQKAPEVRR
jgi:hypothetical protein